MCMYHSPQASYTCIWPYPIKLVSYWTATFPSHELKAAWARRTQSLPHRMAMGQSCFSVLVPKITVLLAAMFCLKSLAEVGMGGIRHLPCSLIWKSRKRGFALFSKTSEMLWIFYISGTSLVGENWNFNSVSDLKKISWFNISFME